MFLMLCEGGSLNWLLTYQLKPISLLPYLQIAWLLNPKSLSSLNDNMFSESFNTSLIAKICKQEKHPCLAVRQ